MYSIEFYRTADGVSDIEEYLNDLLRKASTDKNARIQHKQIAQYIQFLEDYGTRLGEKVTKHLEENVWELRPGKNRVLFFCYENGVFVLLHHFQKKTQKTPRKEIEKAIAERDDYLSRKKGKSNE
ncbi:MAG: type II toxin-antitoxin system RelE/ParE family toxin [Acetatifactor sp.]|nr:type II toxin-antitoxin system RelE/ParE family toxin [Acetatifactor sp.]